MAHQDTASRPEGQAIDAHVLIHCLRAAILVGGRGRNRAADGGAADLAGRGEVLVEARRADLQHTRNVVEPIARVVGRQERRDI